MASYYDVGDEVELTGTFTDPANDDAAGDPTTVSVTITQPDGTTSTYVYGTDDEVTRESVGVYHYNLDITTAGIWYYRWFSTGTLKASGWDMIVARPQAV